MRAALRRRIIGPVSVGAALTGALVLAGGAAASAVVAGGGFGQQHVGQTTANGVLLPTGQTVDPYGRRTLVDNGRLLSSAISPDGKTLAALSWTSFQGSLTLIDIASGKVKQQLGMPGGEYGKTGDGTVAADGPLWSPDGRTLWVSQSADLVKVAMTANGNATGKPTVIPLSGPHGPALPSGGTFSADGTTLYLALNGSNTLGVIDTRTNQLLKQIPVGNAPRQVVRVGSELYVSNEGGRSVKPGDTTNLSYGTPVVSDPVTGAANTGSLSVVDIAAGKQTQSVKVGLQPTAMSLHGTVLMVANSNDDSVSLVDTTTKKVMQTFNVNPVPGATVGSYPNAVTMPDSSHILVSIGRDNAVAVYKYSGPKTPVAYQGLIPTDWYPVNVAWDAPLGKLVVTNDKGIGARGLESPINKGPSTNTVTGHNTYDDTGSVTTFAPPSEADLGGLTHRVFVNNDWEKLLSTAPTKAAAAAKAAPVAVPAQLGQPSKIKHVFLIVKENRSYDQVLGDIGKGNSDPSLTQFGGSVTPNQHRLSDTYGLFDNFYNEGTLSADGHNWLMQADANDYVEKEFGAFYRSYPAQGGDALAYQRDGFLWNAAQKAGQTVQDYGEYLNFETVPATGGPTWADWYKDSQILEGKATGPLPVPIEKYKSYSDIPSLNPITDMAFPKFDLNIPDQYRVDIWKQSFAKAEAANKLANLNMMWVMDDHTAGVGGGTPYPTAEVADNDLAVGRIVDTISHSKDWASSAIVILEDDPQNGADHVDGHRSTLQIVSPYAKRNVVNSNYYTQLNVVKTIEQILGIAPMNQEDRAAEPMYDAFTNTPDFTPYTTQPNQIPLTFGLNGAVAGTAKAAVASTQAHATTPVVPAAEMGTYQQWVAWTKKQTLTGGTAKADSANPAQMNRLNWYAATGWVKPYPGDHAVLAPDQVPGKNLPNSFIGDN
jgi:YVTN family beta-propeller protein